MTSSRTTALKRYPALLFMLVSAVLAGLLPSALRLPLSGPSASAELAPVPGESDAAGDLADLGQTGTQGLGAGGGNGGMGGDGSGTGGFDEETPQDPGDGDSPRTKRCVGRPPRQTEDLLSPPCVAHFEGDNGGATTTGVTAHEITVVHVSEPCTRAEVEVVDYRDGNDDDDIPHLAAYQRYFSERFQLYGRIAHFYSYTFPCSNIDPPPAELRAAAEELHRRLRPFAVFVDRATSALGVDTFLEELARLGVVVVTQSQVRRATAQRWSPHMISYAPDLDDRAEIEADAVCQKLAGRNALYSGNLSDRTRTRKFGLVHDPEPSTGIIPEQLAVDLELFFAALDRRCGLRGIPVATGRNRQDKVIALERLRNEGVTTLLFFGTSNDWSLAADSIKWYPEVFVGGSWADATGASWHAPLVWANAFGVTYDRRRGPQAEQDWFLAFAESCDRCDNTFSWETVLAYEDLLLLFWGIQSAGPRLTPANMDRGLRAIKPRPSPDPSLPAAYFSPGNHSWIKDATFVWWDPQGEPPGSTSRGCYRLLDQGRRYRAGEWPAGDDGIKGRNEPNQPCQGLI